MKFTAQTLAERTSASTHRIRQRIQLQIPSKYSQEPILSTLINRFELEVNILGALMASNAQESGWFDLELCGLPSQIQAGREYLSQLQIEIWGDQTSEGDWSFQ